MISISLLRTFCLQADEHELALPSQKARALVAYLACHAGKAVSREKVACLLWENSAPQQADRSLRQALVALRRELGAEAKRIVPSRFGGLVLVCQEVEIDLLTFEALVRSSRREDLERGVGLYRSELLTDFPPVSESFDEWKLAERARLSSLAGDALERLAAAQARAGDLTLAIASARRLIALDPFREDAHRLLMRLFVQGGRRAEALRQYALCAEILKRELSVQPDAETVALMQSIREERLVACHGQDGKVHLVHNPELVELSSGSSR